METNMLKFNINGYKWGSNQPAQLVMLILGIKPSNAAKSTGTPAGCWYPKFNYLSRWGSSSIPGMEVQKKQRTWHGNVGNIWNHQPWLIWRWTAMNSDSWAGAPARTDSESLVEKCSRALEKINQAAQASHLWLINTHNISYKFIECLSIFFTIVYVITSVSWIQSNSQNISISSYYNCVKVSVVHTIYSSNTDVRCWTGVNILFSSSSLAGGVEPQKNKIKWRGLRTKCQ